MTIINDILVQIENASLTVKDEELEDKTATDTTHEKNRERKSVVNINQGDVNSAFDTDEEVGVSASSNAGNDTLELQATQTIKEKVIPLYTPEDAVVRVFMIHGSQKSALALASFAVGFQGQVIYRNWTLG